VLYNTYRPKRFADVLGQTQEKRVLQAVLEDRTRLYPPLMLTGPYGTGKTTLSRVIAASVLCQDRRLHSEPCGVCPDCRAIFNDSSLNYREIDSASHGLVGDMRALKEEVNFSVAGGKTRIFSLDESHMLSTAGQNSLLQLLETGKAGVLFIFATTNYEKMLPTLRSRCVMVNLRLLTIAEVLEGLKRILDKEKLPYEENALRVIASYARGHMRDAVVLLQQVLQIKGEVTESLVRDYLRLDMRVVLYELLLEEDQATLAKRLEEVLCNLSPREVLDGLGRSCLNSYKVQQGYGVFEELDRAWLQKVSAKFASKEVLLEKAERFFIAPGDEPSIDLCTVQVLRILQEGLVKKTESVAVKASAIPSVGSLRKPSR